MSTLVAWWDRHQIALYLGGIALAAAVGAVVPGAEHLEAAIDPSLGLLLFATFLAVPLGRVARAVRDLRFVGAAMLLNFAVVPLVVLAITRPIAGDDALLLGVLLVLLTPCIDYVIVFSGLAGAAHHRLLAAAPLLLIAQMLLLPLYLLLFIGPELASVVEPAPFVRALVLLIVLPLAAAALVQSLSARGVRAADRVEHAAAAAMVPLMVLTLSVVVASQVPALATARWTTVLAVVPVYVVFLVVMAPIGRAVGRAARLEPDAVRAVTFSGATRNSLVVLPLALALPSELAVVAIVVVTQTVVELVGMVVYVRVVPRLVPGAGPETQ